MPPNRFALVVAIVSLLTMANASAVFGQANSDPASGEPVVGEQPLVVDENRIDWEIVSDELPGRHPTQSKLDALRRKVGPDRRRVGPIGIERDGAYMSSELPVDDETSLDLGYFKAKPSKGYIGLRLRIVPKPGSMDLFGPRRPASLGDTPSHLR